MRKHREYKDMFCTFHFEARSRLGLFGLFLLVVLSVSLAVGAPKANQPELDETQANQIENDIERLKEIERSIAKTKSVLDKIGDARHKIRELRALLTDERTDGRKYAENCYVMIAKLEADGESHGENPQSHEQESSILECQQKEGYRITTWKIFDQYLYELESEFEKLKSIRAENEKRLGELEREQILIQERMLVHQTFSDIKQILQEL